MDGPPLVDEDRHVVCQAIYQGVEGGRWENWYFEFVEMNRDDNVRHPNGKSKAKLPWMMRDVNSE